MKLKVFPKVRPPLDPDFIPAVLWNRAYEEAVRVCGNPDSFTLDLGPCQFDAPDADLAALRDSFSVLPDDDSTVRYAERRVKFRIWQMGARGLITSGASFLVDALKKFYAPHGKRVFDLQVMKLVYDRRAGGEGARGALGGHVDGCRIGFDLGASDRKCAAVIGGKLVHAEEVAWDPAAHSNPDWHIAEIKDSIRRAAVKLPRVDAIGGCAAGIIFDSAPRISSLFRAVPETSRPRLRHVFSAAVDEWKEAKFVVVNDGAAAALAGAMAHKNGAILGLALGSSLAAGYVDAKGHIGHGLDELAFAPVDYREDAPLDEWSGDRGCGVQYLSQQAVARLLPQAGIELEPGLTDAEKLRRLQELAEEGNEGAAQVCRTLGVYLGYALAHYKSFYEFDMVVVMGRVLSGPGGEIILKEARKVMAEEFPEMRCRLETLSERDRRHGQAVAAASLPALESKGDRS